MFFFTTPPEARPSYIPVSLQEYKQLITSDSEKGLSDVTGVLARNVHMPLYFFLMHYWIKLTGTSEWTLRFPSVIFGTLAVLLVFLLGKELINSSVGLLGALLTAFMPDQIYFSQEARMYSLLVLLITSSTCALVLARKKPSSVWAYILYAFISVAGLYTHYVYVFCFAAQTLFIWITVLTKKERLRRWLITQLSVIAAVFPWLIVGLTQKRTSTDVIAWIHGSPPSGSVLHEVFSGIASLIAVPEIPLGWLTVAIACTLLTLGAISLYSDQSAILLLCLWVIIPITGIVFMDVFLGAHAISVIRYWMVITPALYLLMAVGFRKISRWPYNALLVAIVVVCLSITAVWTARGQLRNKADEHLEMGNYVDKQIINSDREFVLTDGSNAIPLILAYYCQHDMNILQYGWTMQKQKPRSYLDILRRSKTILLVSSGKSRAKKTIEESGFASASMPMQFGHVSVQRFTK